MKLRTIADVGSGTSGTIVPATLPVVKKGTKNFDIFALCSYCEDVIIVVLLL